MKRRPATAVFDTDAITLQSVRGCQQVFSAAFIAHVEAAYQDDEVKNDVCAVVPHPDSDLDWLRVTIADNRNQLRWMHDPALMAWLDASRLDLFSQLRPRLPDSARTRERLLQIVTSNLKALNERLERLLSRADVDTVTCTRQDGMRFTESSSG